MVALVMSHRTCMMALVESVVEDHLALQGELERITTEVWLADDAPSGTSWMAGGVAGLGGYLIGQLLRGRSTSSQTKRDASQTPPASFRASSQGSGILPLQS